MPHGPISEVLFRGGENVWPYGVPGPPVLRMPVITSVSGGTSAMISEIIKKKRILSAENASNS